MASGGIARIDLGSAHQQQLQRLAGGKGAVRAEGPVVIALDDAVPAQLPDVGIVPVVLLHIPVGVDPGGVVDFRLDGGGVGDGRTAAGPPGVDVEGAEDGFLARQLGTVGGKPAQERLPRQGRLRQKAVDAAGGIEHRPAGLVGTLLPAVGLEVYVAVAGAGIPEFVIAVEEQKRLPEPPGHQVFQNRVSGVAPGGDGVDDLRLAVAVEAVDQVGAQPVLRVDPLGPQVVGHADQGVKLLLGDGDAVLHQKAVHQALVPLCQVGAQQRVRLQLGDAGGVVAGFALGAVTDVPLPAVVRIGHGPEALEFLYQRDARLAGGKGFHRQGRAGQQRQRQRRAQRQGQQLFQNGFFLHRRSPSFERDKFDKSLP